MELSIFILAALSSSVKMFSSFSLFLQNAETKQLQLFLQNAETKQFRLGLQKGRVYFGQFVV